MVVLISGSMRMTVESVEDEAVNVVWCHEGRVDRDSFHERLLNKWEVREDHRGGGHRGDDRGHRGGGKPWQDRGERGGERGEREHGGHGHGGHGGRGRDDRPRGKTGWDGKPREKKYFRKDG